MTIPELRKQIEEYLELDKAKTEGPWEFNVASSNTSRIWQESRNDGLYLRCDSNLDIVHDTEFIATAANQSADFAQKLVIALDALERIKRAGPYIRFEIEPHAVVCEALDKILGGKQK